MHPAGALRAVERHREETQTAEAHSQRVGRRLEALRVEAQLPEESPPRAENRLLAALVAGEPPREEPAVNWELVGQWATCSTTVSPRCYRRRGFTRPI